MRRRLIATATLVVLALAGPAWPVTEEEGVAKVDMDSGGIRWEPMRRYASMTLSVAGPGFEKSRTFKEEAPELKVKTKAGVLADGTYTWDLRVQPDISPETREQLAAAREAMDRGMKVDMRELDVPDVPTAQSGVFTVREGRIVSPREKEPEPKSRGEEPTRFDGDLEVTGNLLVEGKKAFVATDPANPGASLVYVALEGPEAGTYLRGSAVTVDGEARIELPAHFAGVTEAEGLTVQLTPEGGWSHLYVAEKSPALLVVREAEGRDGIRFDYLIQGVRRGHADHRVERDQDGD